MAAENHIRNPFEWGVDQLRLAGRTAEGAGRSIAGTEETRYSAPPAVARIGMGDIREALRRGWQDVGACRTDVILVCAVYPLVGLLLARAAFGYDMLPLLFPLAAGFALIGPVAAVGLYEMSRRRERGEQTGWSDAFALARSPRCGAILALGLMLLGIFVAWLVAAQAIYSVTLGPEAPASPSAFLSDVFTTSAGWTMIVAGMGVGFLFAVLVLVVSVVSFPMLVDRDIGLPVAVGTSIRAAAANPGAIAAWGLIVAGLLLIGSIPLFLGLVLAMPLLGHATWHLYRRLVPAV